MELRYPSDITREQFGTIEPLLSSANKKTRPREMDLYHIFCAILYILKSGCQWRMLPKDYPKWYNVYYYFKIWSKRKDENPSLFEQALKKIS
jgi:transposase